MAGRWNGFDQVLVPLMFKKETYIGISIVLSLLMVSDMPLFSLKFKSFGWKGNEVRYSFLVFAVIMMSTVYWTELYFWVLPILILLYVLVSVIVNLTQRKVA